MRPVARICEDHGQRVQYRVFAYDPDPARWTAMRARLVAAIDAETDSLRFSFLGGVAPAGRAYRRKAL